MPKIIPRETLNPKQERFAREYLIDLNATQAAIRAGYSKKTAGQKGFTILRSPKVQAFVQHLREKQCVKLEITAERVLQEYGRIAFFDIRKLYTPKGQLKPVNELDDDAAAVLAGIDVDEMFEFSDGKRTQVGITKKLKTWNKNQALDSLGEHLGLLKGDESPLVVKVVIKPKNHG
jgi:phage terminase small subunit